MWTRRGNTLLIVMAVLGTMWEAADDLHESDWGRDGGLLLIHGTSTDPVLRGGSADIDCW
ncbi:hypothetical protein ACF09J_10415 [Streptomyces sp. NPDC014889]|uniref:hypothetical protein n=1 Tax=Streptomyces sp. NPDC014889 TaxID=3364928 RepID=UPI00370333EE